MSKRKADALEEDHRKGPLHLYRWVCADWSQNPPVFKLMAQPGPWRTETPPFRTEPVSIMTPSRQDPEEDNGTFGICDELPFPHRKMSHNLWFRFKLDDHKVEYIDHGPEIRKAVAVSTGITHIPQLVSLILDYSSPCLYFGVWETKYPVKQAPSFQQFPDLQEWVKSGFEKTALKLTSYRWSFHTSISLNPRTLVMHESDRHVDVKRKKRRKK
jgi:hypothetical protein